MSFGGGGGDPGREARRQEEERQRRIAAAVDTINAIFDGKPIIAGEGLATSYNPNQAYFDAKGNRYTAPIVRQGGSDPRVAIQAMLGWTPMVVNTDEVMRRINNGDLYTGVKNISPAPRQQLYDEQKQAVFDINKRDVDRQYDMAERDNRFGLARAGLI